MWISSKELIRSCLSISLTFMLGCGLIPFQEEESGSISFVVEFPENYKFQTKLIKPETVKLFAAVYGDDLPFSNPLISSPILRPDAGSNGVARKEMRSVPTGDQMVLVAAYDDKNKILTAGKAQTKVIGDQTTRVEIELVEAFQGKLTSAEVNLLASIPVDEPEPEKPKNTPENQASNQPGQNTNQNNSQKDSSPSPDTSEKNKDSEVNNTSDNKQPTENTDQVNNEKQDDNVSTNQVTSFLLVRPAGDISVTTNSSVTLAATVADPLITQVEFFVGTQKLATLTKEPFEFIWSTVDFNDGDHEVKAIAKDVDGKIIAISEVRKVTVRRSTTSNTQPEAQGPPPSPAPTPSPTPTPNNIDADVTVNDGTTVAVPPPGAF